MRPRGSAPAGVGCHRACELRLLRRCGRASGTGSTPGRALARPDTGDHRRGSPSIGVFLALVVNGGHWWSNGGQMVVLLVVALVVETSHHRFIWSARAGE